MTGRLSTIAAALVIARRDFVAILFSRSFIFFLLGPVFTLGIGTMAGGLGQRLQSAEGPPIIGLAMSEMDNARVRLARDSLTAWDGGVNVPQVRVLANVPAGTSFDADEALANAATGHESVVAVLSGSPAAPVLTGSAANLQRWRGTAAVLAAQADGHGLSNKPTVLLDEIVYKRKRSERRDMLLTAQGAQTLLFLLTMILAGMVLSNLVEEKANKIIEILAAAIPMDAVFLGKLFAMLAVSFVGIAVWATAGTALGFAIGKPLDLPAPAVGWPMLGVLGIIYFSTAYLLLGSVFLSIGSMATTVREVQTLSMPVTMMQLVVYFFATYAMTRPGSFMDYASIMVPFSSPYAMLARAAQQPELWPHVVAIVWQLFWVAIFIRIGARLFRSRVMKSGPSHQGRRRNLLSRFRLGRNAARA